MSCVMETCRQVWGPLRSFGHAVPIPIPINHREQVCSGGKKAYKSADTQTHVQVKNSKEERQTEKKATSS